MPESGKEREIIGGLLEDAAAAFDRGGIAKAKALYSGILRLNPNDPTALRRLAAIEINAGEAQSALELLQRVSTAATIDATLCHEIATALRLSGDTKGFRLALEAALRIDANYAPAIYDIAVFYQQEKKSGRGRTLGPRQRHRRPGRSTHLFESRDDLSHLGISNAGAVVSRPRCCTRAR